MTSHKLPVDIHYCSLVKAPTFMAGLSKVEFAECRHSSLKSVQRDFNKTEHNEFKSFIRAIRIELAPWLARMTDINQEDIAKLCGYETDWPLHKLFRDHFNLKISCYRKIRKYCNTKRAFLAITDIASLITQGENTLDCLMDRTGLTMQNIQSAIEKLNDIGIECPIIDNGSQQFYEIKKWCFFDPSKTINNFSELANLLYKDISLLSLDEKYIPLTIDTLNRQPRY